MFSTVAPRWELGLLLQVTPWHPLSAQVLLSYAFALTHHLPKEPTLLYFLQVCHYRITLTRKANDKNPPASKVSNNVRSVSGTSTVPLMSDKKKNF
jgi:hypothetical protein